MTPVYFEKDEDQPGVQNIIMFPDGIQGKQMYIYQNKSHPTDIDESDQKNNVLDICEVEMWGISFRTTLYFLNVKANPYTGMTID